MSVLTFRVAVVSVRFN